VGWGVHLRRRQQPQLRNWLRMHRLCQIAMTLRRVSQQARYRKHARAQPSGAPSAVHSECVSHTAVATRVLMPCDGPAVAPPPSEHLHGRIAMAQHRQRARTEAPCTAEHDQRTLAPSVSGGVCDVEELGRPGGDACATLWRSLLTEIVRPGPCRRAYELAWQACLGGYSDGSADSSHSDKRGSDSVRWC